MIIPLLTEYEKEHLSERQPLPERYLSLSDEEMDRRIRIAKSKLGRRLVILGHHYQRDEVIKFADYTGDSFKLAGQVSKHPEADYIVFCGVHFMAESADVLSGGHQQVILPDLAAGCSMADMADPEQLEQCWSDLQQMGLAASSAEPCVPSSPRRPDCRTLPRQWCRGRGCRCQIDCRFQREQPDWGDEDRSPCCRDSCRRDR